MTPAKGAPAPAADAASVAPARSSLFDARLSLADLCSSGAEVGRDGAVAVVHGLCRAILDGQEPLSGAGLDLEEVFLEPYGTIALTSRPDPQIALPSVKHVLHDLLPANEFIVAKALPDSTLEEFSRALSYYVPRDTLEAIQDVYRRAHMRPLPEAPPAELEAPVALAETLISRWIREVRSIDWLRLLQAIRLPRWRPEPLLVAAVMLGTTSVALFAWGLSGRRAEPKPPQASVAEPTPLVAETPAPELPAPRASTSRSPRLAPTSRSAVTPGSIRPQADRAVASRPRADRPAASRPQPAERPAGQSRLPTVPVSGPVGLVGSSPSLTLSRIDGSTRPAATPKPEPVEPVATSTVFDATQSDVVPPQFVYPLLPVPIPAGGAGLGIPAIEVTINEQGTIDGVKASIPPRTIAEAVKMLGELSAAKAWRFRPASRNGHPVKYRLVVPLSIL